MSRRLLVVEDHALVCEGIAQVVLGHWPDTAVQRAPDLRQALRHIDMDGAWRAPGAIIITDLNLPDSHGLDTLARLRARAPAARIGVVSGSSDLALALDCLREGACAFVPKAGSLAHFTDGLRTLAHGGVYFPRELLAQARAASGLSPVLSSGQAPADTHAGSRLTPRQHEVRTLLLHGLSNALIAEHLGISEETVKLHVRAILRAHGALNRVQLLLACAREEPPRAAAS